MEGKCFLGLSAKHNLTSSWRDYCSADRRCTALSECILPIISRNCWWVKRDWNHFMKKIYIYLILKVLDELTDYENNILILWFSFIWKLGRDFGEGERDSFHLLGRKKKKKNSKNKIVKTRKEVQSNIYSNKWITLIIKNVLGIQSEILHWSWNRLDSTVLKNKAKQKPLRY